MSRLAALALLGAVPVGHAHAATTEVKVSAKVIKPLEFTKKQDLDFGQILLTAGPSFVSIDMGGVLTCGAGLTCTGVPLHAIFNVAGSNGQVVRITAVASDLVNTADGSRIQFTPVAPASVTLTNAGQPGEDFGVGGSIDIPADATDGTYVGNIAITAQYQ